MWPVLCDPAAAPAANTAYQELVAASNVFGFALDLTPPPASSMSALYTSPMATGMRGCASFIHGRVPTVCQRCSRCTQLYGFSLWVVCIAPIVKQALAEVVSFFLCGMWCCRRPWPAAAAIGPIALLRESVRACELPRCQWPHAAGRWQWHLLRLPQVPGIWSV